MRIESSQTLWKENISVIEARFTVIEGESDLAPSNGLDLYDQLVCRVRYDGERLETNFDDLQFFDKYVKGRPFARQWHTQHEGILQNIGIATITKVTPGYKGMPSMGTFTMIDLSQYRPQKGEIIRVLPRLVDFNLPKVMKNLVRIDQHATREGRSYFLNLLQDSEGIGARQMPDGSQLEAQALRLITVYNERNRISDDVRPLIFKRSQRAAMLSILRQHLTIIWGPPGTGKTHTLALSLMYYLQLMHESTTTKVVVWMTAMSKAAIGMFKRKFESLCNVIRAIRELRHDWLDDLEIRDLRTESYDTIDSGSKRLQLIVGTVWSLFNGCEKGKFQRPNALLMDEAGQVTVAAAATVIGKLDENGRLICTAFCLLF